MTASKPIPCPQARGGAAPLRLCPRGSAGTGPGKGRSRWLDSGQSGLRWRSLRWPGGCRLCTVTGGHAGSHCTWTWEGRGHQACWEGEAELPVVADQETRHLASHAQLPPPRPPPQPRASLTLHLIIYARPHICSGSPSSRAPQGPPSPTQARHPILPLHRSPGGSGRPRSAPTSV